MCRYVAYLGQPMVLSRLVNEPANSLINQASDALESRTRVNGDGFGIGWYNPQTAVEPAVFKDVSPAWNNANLRSLATTVTSHCILAHVRAARRFDPVSRDNCHPFQAGRLLWMHNGDIPGRARLHRRVVELASDDLVARLAGNTDTELAFTLFLTILGETGRRSPSAEALADAMVLTVERLVDWYRTDRDDRPMALNFCVSEGTSLVALRLGIAAPEIPSLHLCRGGRYVCRDGSARLDDDGSYRSAILASEALSDDAHWAAVEEGTLVVVHDPATVEFRRLAA